MSDRELANARLSEVRARLTLVERDLDLARIALARVTLERNAIRYLYQFLLRQYGLLRQRVNAERLEMLAIAKLDEEFAVVKRKYESMPFVTTPTEPPAKSTDK